MKPKATKTSAGYYIEQENKDWPEAKAAPKKRSASWKLDELLTMIRTGVLHVPNW